MAAPHSTLPTLIVQADPALGATMCELVARTDPTRVEWVGTLADALSASDHHLAVVVLDLDLPDSAGRDTFYRFTSERPDHPVLVVTDHPREPVGHELIRAGATEVVGFDCVEQGLLGAAVDVAATRWERRRRLVDLNVDTGVLTARISRHEPLLGEAAERLTALEERLRSSPDVTVRPLARTVADTRARFHAEPLDDSPLVEWLGTLRSMAGPRGPRMSIECTVESLSPDIERHVRAATQEMVANALKHARASTISIEIHECGHEINVRVSDDGHGLGDELVPGDGLLNLERRAHVLGGGFRHRRARGCTHLDWWVPAVRP